MNVDAPYLVPRVRHVESNGTVTVFEEGSLPFGVRRTFMVTSQRGQIRGSHAHKVCWQALFAISGHVVVEATYSRGVSEFTLVPDGDGLVIPPMVWATQEYIGLQPVLLVMCSHKFDEDDYIRSFTEYRAILSKTIALTKQEGHASQ